MQRDCWDPRSANSDSRSVAGTIGCAKETLDRPLGAGTTRNYVVRCRRAKGRILTFKSSAAGQPAIGASASQGDLGRWECVLAKVQCGGYGSANAFEVMQTT